MHARLARRLLKAPAGQEVYMFGVSLNQDQMQQVSKSKADFKQMPVSPEMQNILSQNGAPKFANLGELQSFMSDLQRDNPGRYNQLFDAMHPGLRNQGVENTPSPIHSIGR
jgi:hypothetical protein